MAYFLTGLFMIEGILGKAKLPFFNMSTGEHVVITIVFIFIFFLFHVFKKNTVTLDYRYKRIQYSLLVFICIGGISSLLQLNWHLNIIFWFIWAANIYVIWWSIPVLMTNYKNYQICNLVVFILMITVFGALMNPGEIAGRMGGIFQNPTVSARLFVILYLISLAQILTSIKFKKYSFLIIIISVALLIMTKTRASLFAGFVGTIVIISHATWITRNRYLKNRLILIWISTFIAGCGLFFAGAFSSEMLSLSIKYIRINGDLHEIYYSARAMNWEFAIQEAKEYGLFGMGFLSKFGVTDLVYINGFVLPEYNWESPDDPLNMLLLVAKQTGWFSCFLFILFITFLWLNAFSKDDLLQKYVIYGVLSAGMVFGLVDGNWLTSFGDPVDRISMVLIALILSKKNEISNQKNIILKRHQY